MYRIDLDEKDGAALLHALRTHASECDDEADGFRLDVKPESPLARAAEALRAQAGHARDLANRIQATKA